jgi:hypothetical protein
LQEKMVYALTASDRLVTESNNNEVDSLQNPLEKLHTPPYIQTSIRYDFLTQRYILEKRIGSTLLSEPVYMTFDEYKRYNQQQNQTSYFRERNSLTYNPSQSPQRYQLPQRKKKRDPMESVFGPYLPRYVCCTALPELFSAGSHIHNSYSYNPNPDG